MYLVKVYSQYELTYINYVPILVNKKNKEICKSQSIEHKTQIFYGTLALFVGWRLREPYSWTRSVLEL